MSSLERSWKLAQLPPIQGWYTFRLEGRTAKVSTTAEPDLTKLRFSVRGYLVGDRLVADDATVRDPAKISGVSEQVHLIDPGVERFARVRAGRIFKEGPLIFWQQEMPLGPESDVHAAYLDRSPLEALKNITPALEAAFRLECWLRAETERRRAELETKRLEEERQRQVEEQRRLLVEKLGDGQGRRTMAKVDFEEAARAALRVGGAELLDHRKAGRGEWVVRYRCGTRRLECVCDADLQIIDAGICLTDHDTGEKGDTYFTLESLPSVVREAEREGKLVVYRHV